METTNNNEVTVKTLQERKTEVLQLLNNSKTEYINNSEMTEKINDAIDFIDSKFCKSIEILNRFLKDLNIKFTNKPVKLSYLDDIYTNEFLELTNDLITDKTFISYNIFIKVIDGKITITDKVTTKKTERQTSNNDGKINLPNIYTNMYYNGLKVADAGNFNKLNLTNKTVQYKSNGKTYDIMFNGTNWIYSGNIYTRTEFLTNVKNQVI